MSINASSAGVTTEKLAVDSVSKSPPAGLSKASSFVKSGSKLDRSQSVRTSARPLGPYNRNTDVAFNSENGQVYFFLKFLIS
jgi:hypothetical protein